MMVQAPRLLLPTGKFDDTAAMYATDSPRFKNCFFTLCVIAASEVKLLHSIERGDSMCTGYVISGDQLPI